MNHETLAFRFSQCSDFEVLRCETVFQNKGWKSVVYNSEFGPVNSGSLLLRGRLRAAIWKPGMVDARNPNQTRTLSLYRENTDRTLFAMAYPDAAFAETASVDSAPVVYLLKMLEGDREIRGLMLKSETMKSIPGWVPLSSALTSGLYPMGMMPSPLKNLRRILIGLRRLVSKPSILFEIEDGASKYLRTSHLFHNFRFQLKRAMPLIIRPIHVDRGF